MDTEKTDDGVITTMGVARTDRRSRREKQLEKMAAEIRRLCETEEPQDAADLVLAELGKHGL